MLVRVSIAVIQCHDQNQLGEEKLAQFTDIAIQGNQDRSPRQELMR